MNNLYYEIELLGVKRLVHQDDYNPKTLEKLNEKLNEVTPCKWISTTTGEEKIALIQTILGPCAHIKFIESILGHLYEEDAWQATTTFTCDVNKIKVCSYQELIS